MKLSSLTIQITSRHLKIRRRNSRALCNRDVIMIITLAMCETSCEIECDDVQQEVEVRTVTWSRRRVCLLDLLWVPSSSLSNLTSSVQFF